LLGDGGSEVFIHKEAVDSVVEFSGGNAAGLGKGLPLGKGRAAPPRAACCSRVVEKEAGSRRQEAAEHHDGSLRNFVFKCPAR
jgi:hypothetical protein